jgi:hypothetical protein
MTGTRDPMPQDELELRLSALAGAVDLPPTPNLAASVGRRLRERAALASATPASAGPRPLRRSLPRAVLLAAALALLVVGAAFAVRFGLELLSIETGPLPTSLPSPGAPTHPSPGSTTSGRPGAGLGLGLLVDLEAAEASTPFPILVPADLGPPDAVYLGGAALRGQVALVYAADEDLPASDLLGGAGLLVTQNRGEADDGLASKLADAKLATVEPVDVDGAPGVWISGQPHVFWYFDPSGAAIEDSRRLVGDTLAWERDGILYRIEGAIDLERALAVAMSMR